MHTSNQKPMADTVRDNTMKDCNEILHNAFETKTEANTYYKELIEMANAGASETMIYARLQEITDQEKKDG